LRALNGENMSIQADVAVSCHTSESGSSSTSKTVFVKLDKNIQIMRAVEEVYRTGPKEEIIG